MLNAHDKAVAKKPSKTSILKASLLLSVGFSTLTMSSVALAQDNSDDEVIVTGSRQVIQDSIALKRENTQIVDGLSAEEIGDIPALSIGEALETITGVASHRENGGATEVSVRGLGPYLSSTVVNGRVATNGSGDRSVNFSQFPSELINRLEVFKTQNASQIEGGVAGQINLETIKPLDYGKQRLQFEVKGNVNPDQLNQDDTEAGDIGYRLTGSYTDQFETGAGDIGISIGVQRSDISQPEAEARQTGPTSNSRPACLISDGIASFIEPQSMGTATGFSNNPETRRRGDDDCDDVNVEGFDLSDTSGSANPTAAELAGFRNGSGSRVEGVDTRVNSATGVANDFGVPFAFAPSQRHYRQNDTRDQRDAIFGSVQFQPNDRLDVNLDAQWSERTLSEQRNDLTFNGGRRNDTSLNVLDAEGNASSTTTLNSLVLTPQGGILRGITDNSIEVQGGDFERKETYLGGGLNVEYHLTSRLKAKADVGYSKTERTERAFEFRIQSNASPVIEFDQRDRDVGVFTLHSEQFDVNDPSNYVDRLRVRIDNDLYREDQVLAGRLDFDYDLGGDGFFTNIEAGVRYGARDYLSLGGGIDSNNPYNRLTGRTTFEIEDNRDLEIQSQQVFDSSGELADRYIGFIADVNEACYTGSTPEEDFLGSLRDEDIVTNRYVDSDGNFQSVGTNTWATFGARCVAETGVNLINSINAEINEALQNSSINDLRGDPTDPIALLSTEIPDLIEERDNTVDVQEDVTSAYLMTNYEGTFDSLPISGNLGVRLVQTDVTATGYREAITITENDEGEFSLVRPGFTNPGAVQQLTEEHSYTRVLPSANLIVDIADDKLLRFGVFRSMSRADPQDLGFSRIFTTNIDEDGSETASIDDVIGEIRAVGNPKFDPLMSWNYDASFEWYPNADSILAIGTYYKKFQGGFETVIQPETFEFNGESITRNVTTTQTSEQTSNLFGVEITASHGFTYLPGLLSGLGAKISYNYVDSDFEFEDSRYGDKFTRQPDGTLVQTNQGIIAPGGLPGLSENTISAQVYYGIGGLDLAVNYKYRDEYFQPFIADGTRLRFVGDVAVWEARASYKINDNFRLSAEAINIFSEPKEQFAFVRDDRYEINDYGPRIFFGLRGRF
jgi:TonB-dependent receptor